MRRGVDAQEEGRRDAILEAVGFASERLMEAVCWEDVIQDVLERLCRAAGASRAYILESDDNTENRAPPPRRYEWSVVAAESEANVHDPRGSPVGVAHTPRWREMLLRGKPVQGKVRDFPPGERETLAAQDILSLLLVPIFVGEKWWGTLRLDECRRERDWSRAEIDALRTAARILGACIRRCEAEEALRKTNETLQVLVEALPLGISVLDRFGNVSVWNPAAERIFGWTEQDVLGRPLPTIAEDREDEFRAFLQRVSKGESVLGWEIQRRRNDGSTIDMRVSASPIYGAGNRIDGIVVLYSDITEQKQLEHELLRARLLETTGMTAGQVAHDFNNLLSPLISYPQLMKEELPQGHPALRYCDVMMEAASRMAEINADMLALARRGHVERQQVDLNRLALEAVSQMLNRPDTLVLDLQLDPFLPPVAGSPAQLLRVLTNLISNARDAMEDAGVLAIQTRVVAAEDLRGKSGHGQSEQYVLLEVADTGCGIPHEIRDSIFDTFFTTKRGGTRRGSGLGLSVVQAIVEDHCGFVDLESEVGKGSTFRVYLPVSRDETGSRAREDEEDETNGGS